MYKQYTRKVKRTALLVSLIVAIILFTLRTLSMAFDWKLLSDICLILIILNFYTIVWLPSWMQDDFLCYVSFTPDGKCHIDVNINNGPTNYYKFNLETIVAEKFDKKQLRIMDKERPNDSISIHIPYCEELEFDINQAKRDYLENHKKSDENT